MTILDEELLQELEDRLPSWCKNGHDKLIWKAHKIIRKYYDPSRVIKLMIEDEHGVKRIFKIHSDKYFKVKIESEHE